tara:strand:+ start:47660 stop:50608 length:2949 start_codon:yes stop_codon:yes gene_type:complete
MKHPSTQAPKLFALVIIMVFSFLKTNAQQTAMQLANKELRYLFQYVSNPNPNVKFFYDLSSHYVDSAYFNTYVTDTNNVQNWYGLYQEMYYMTYDTAQYINADSVFNLIYPTFQSDTIPIGVIDWDFNLLKQDALNTNIYFDFDVVNDVLNDKVGAPNPYTIQTTFAGCALRKTYPFTNPVYEVNPNWIFKDALKDYSNSEMVFKIDFGDGSGWHVFNDTQAQHYQAQYSSKGVKLLKYAIFEAGIIIKFSVSAIFIISDNALLPPNETWNLPGLTIGVYNPDFSCNVNTEKKYAIYLSGFDPLENTNIAEMYQSMLVDNNITQLKNFGYTILVVDWKNSHRDIQDNADYVINLLEYLKCLPKAGTDIVEPKPPFVMIAHSMGGLVARYALTTMEQSNYSSSCNTYGVAHNTRLLITADTPHQGANIPLAYQYLYRYASFTALYISPYATAILAKYFLLLNGSASQMLKYHIDTDLYWLLPVSTSSVGEHKNKTIFDSELAALGNYPKYCKLVAISNGSWLGEHQNREWDLEPRVPNDKFLDFNAELRLRILGIRIVGAEFEMIMRSNPSGTGEVFRARAGVSHWKIDLYWFGAKLKWFTSYISNIRKSVSNSEPLCVMPGSYMVSGGLLDPKPSNFNNFNVFSLFEFSATKGSGNLHVNAFLGPQFLGTGVNFDMNAYSDGFGFAFIPTASSFDYNTKGEPLDRILLENPVDVGSIMDRTPFDVVYTNPTERNRQHPYMRGVAKLEVCQTCKTLPNGAPIPSYLINREIGDDTLWLENLNANYVKPIEAERDIFINHRNIYYNYEDGDFGEDGFSTLEFPDYYTQSTGAIVLSKKRSVQFTYPGQLRSNNNLFVNGVQPPIGSFSWQQGVMSICCINYDYKTTPKKPATPSISTGSLNIFPNPTQNKLTIKYQMLANTKVTIKATDMLGRQIAVWYSPFTDHTQECYFGVNESDVNWPTGMYLITVTNGTETYRSQLMINK